MRQAKRKILAVFIIMTIAFSSCAFAVSIGNQLPDDDKNLGGSASNSGTTYVFLDGKRIAALDSGKHFYFTDFLGSTRIVTNENGQLIEKLDYAPFGKELVSSQGEFTFTGKEIDNIGLQYFGSRYYDAETGRFTQNDPKALSEQGSYVYTNDNPLKFIDPDGNAMTPAQKAAQDSALARIVRSEQPISLGMMPLSPGAYAAAGLKIVRAATLAKLLFQAAAGPSTDDKNKAVAEVEKERDTDLLYTFSGEKVDYWNQNYHKRVEAKTQENWHKRLALSFAEAGIAWAPWGRIVNFFRPFKPVSSGFSTEGAAVSGGKVLTHLEPVQGASTTVQTPMGEYTVTQQTVQGQTVLPVVTQGGNQVSWTANVWNWLKANRPDLLPNSGTMTR